MAPNHPTYARRDIDKEAELGFRLAGKPARAGEIG
jgi:hypothetical protein